MAQHKFRLTVLGILVLALVSLLAITACAAYVAADHGDKGEKGEKSEKGQKGEKEPKETPTPTITPTPTPTNTPVPTATAVPPTPTATPVPPTPTPTLPPPTATPIPVQIMSPTENQVLYAKPGQVFQAYIQVQKPSDVTVWFARTSDKPYGSTSAPPELTIHTTTGEMRWTPDSSHAGNRYGLGAEAKFFNSKFTATHYVRFYVEVTDNPPAPTPTSTPVPPPGPTPTPTPPPDDGGGDDPCSTASSQQGGGIFASVLGFFGVEKDAQAQQCVPPPNIAVVASVDIASGTTPYVVGQTLTGQFTIKNNGDGDVAVTMQTLVLGGRLNRDDTCSNYVGGVCPDFNPVSVTINPGAVYTYYQTFVPQLPGSYSFQVFFQTTDGKWYWNLGTENGANNNMTVEVHPKLAFPLQGYTPYTTLVTAVVDHDPRKDYIEIYDGQQGSYWDGCLAYYAEATPHNRPCDPNDPINVAKPRAFKKADGSPFTTPFNYDDFVSGTNNTYIWYDNHTGYDYSVGQGTAVKVAEAGTVTEIKSEWGQVEITHELGYRTYYTHMRNISVSVGQTVSKGVKIGEVSDVGAPGAIHLHFTVKRLVGGTLELLDPYGRPNSPVLWE